jgi:uncharacterized delta-60 repeat protein
VGILGEQSLQRFGIARGEVSMLFAPRALFSLTMAVSILFATRASAMPGDLDPTFGSAGFVETDPGPSTWGSVAGLVDPLGRIVVVGEGSGHHLAAARYLSDGTLDPAFGSGGLVTVVIPPGTTTGDIAWAVARQTDGKLLLAGWWGGAGVSLWPVLARLNEDGSLDGTFGGGGSVVLPVDGSFYDVAVQPDGAIVAAGTGAGDLLVARFAPDGTPDPTFAGDGVATLDLGGEYDVVRSLRIQPDGRILLIGSGGVDAESQGIVLARYDASGTLDPAFGVGGAVTVEDRGGGFTGALQADGKILATSSIPAGGHDELAVTRFDADGTVDTAFGVGGTYRTSVLDQGIYYPRVVVQPDGRLLLVASLNFNASAIVRLWNDGTPDLDFGDGGSRVFLGRYVWSLVEQPTDQKIVGIGAVTTDGSRWKFGLERLQGGCPGPDTDGDGIADTCDLCTNASVASRGVLKFRRLGPPAGDDVLSLKVGGTIPVSPPIDPVTDGVRLVLRDASGRTRLAARFPAVAMARITPPIEGIDRVRVKVKRDGRVNVSMSGRSGTYDVGALPLTATVALAPPSTDDRRCLDLVFASSDCTQSLTKPALKCVLAPP